MTATLRSAVLAAAGIAIAVLPAIFGARLWSVWAACATLLVAAIAIDALLIPRRRSLVLEVASPPALQIGEAGALDLRLSTRGRRRLVPVSALAELGDVFERQPESELSRTADLASASIPLVARRRGMGQVAAVWLRLRGPLGLIEKHIRHEDGRSVAVLPDLRPVRSAALRAANRHETATGARTMRYIGEGSDFAALRDYVPGLDHRAISWRASARHHQLLCREFHAERDQNVVLAIDTGRLMSEPLDGMPRLDHAINAGLLLAWSCLKTGDRVGLFSFGSRPTSFRAPVAGLRSFHEIQGWAAGLDYGLDEANYTLALSYLSERLRRRSLVVLITDFVDVVAARLMIENVTKLVSRHLVLFVTLTDPAPRRLLGADPHAIGDVHRAVVAGQFMRERETVLSRLRRLGAHCIDSEPGELQHEVVQRYLWIKRRELI